MIAGQKTIKVDTREFRANIETFESSAELIRVTSQRETRFGDNTIARRKLEAEWYGASSGKEAMDFCERGWSVKTAEIQKLTREVQKRIPARKQETFNNVCGFAPVVPLALSGSPLSMLDSRQVPKRTRVLDVVYDQTISAMYGADTLLECGMAMLEYVMRLEASGYRVRLSVMADYTDDWSGDICIVRIKQETQPFNIERMCYPLFNPGMFRVIGFGWYERCPTSRRRPGYGRALGYTFDKPEQRAIVHRELFGPHAIVVGATDIAKALKKAKMEDRDPTAEARNYLESLSGIEA